MKGYLAFPRASRENKETVEVFYNLVSIPHITHCDWHLILLVRNELLSQSHSQGENHVTGIPGKEYQRILEHVFF